MYWKKLSHEQIKERIFDALNNNLNYRSEAILGIPGTYLDAEGFYDDAPFLSEAPFLSALISNPNHIGCHTFEDGESEAIFKGTQLIEKELIALMAEEMFKAEPKTIDGYVAPGGTEANIQAMWIYRNFFQTEFDAALDEIALVYSEDSHYSMPKGKNLLSLDSLVLPVEDATRKIDMEAMEQIFDEAQAKGKKYFIFIANMSTTMFGSVDPIDEITDFLNQRDLEYKLHIDAAFGGYIYPFTKTDSSYTFQNPYISSFTVDGHKMLQAPYGTGIFLVRKNLMHYVCTDEAQYVQGKDYTLCGSRSGANAISVWMIMMIHGSQGWTEKMQTLLQRTDDICVRLDKMGIEYFRNPFINIVTMRAKHIPEDLAKRHMLVADSYEGDTKWYKIVVMPHVRRGLIDRFFMDLKQHTTS
jgi:glutamate/tyrosine decarboxylase-like PLP-dependent enzyme